MTEHSKVNHSKPFPRRHFLKLCGFAALGMALANCDSTPTHPIAPPSDLLHIENGKVLNSSGNAIFLRGLCLDPFPFWSFKETPNHPYTLERINLFNRSLYEHYLTEADIQEIKNMGVNVVRKQISFYALELAPYQYNEGVLHQIDHLIEIAYPNGIYVIPALTDAAQNSRQKDNIKHYNGVPYLWDDREWRQRVISAWAHIANRYANNPAIAGYDIINEPEAPTKADLHSFYSDVISEIRMVDSKRIIILEKQHFSNHDILFGGIYEDQNLMLSDHHYEDIQVNEEICNPNAIYLTEQELEALLNEFLAENEVAGRPFYIGEFSAACLPDVGERALQWTSDIMRVMRKYNIHYTYFSYKNIWGDQDPRASLYHPNIPLFAGWQNQPIETVIEYVEARVDDLLTGNWSVNAELKQVLIGHLKSRQAFRPSIAE